MTRFSILAVALVSSFAAAADSVADQIVYNVSFGGVGNPHFADPHVIPGHRIGVSGTVTFATDTQSIVDSSLEFLHESDAPLAMEMRPRELLEGLYWHWLATQSELRLVIDGASPAGFTAFVWGTNPGPTLEDFYGIYGVHGGSFPPFVHLVYSNQDPPDPLFNHGPDDDSVGFIVPSAGFLFGVAVPEPSALTLAVLGTLGLLIAARRKR